MSLFVQQLSIYIWPRRSWWEKVVRHFEKRTSNGITRSSPLKHDPGLAGDEGDGGVLDVALGGDGVEVDSAGVGFAHDFIAVVGDGVFVRNAGDGDEAAAFGSHDFHEGEVFKFGNDAGLNVAIAEPGIERAAERGVLGGEQGRGVMQGIREAAAESGAELFLRTKNGARASERVIEGLEAGAGGGGLIGEHDVEPMGGELLEKVVHFPLPTDDVDGL